MFYFFEFIFLYILATFQDTLLLHSKFPLVLALEISEFTEHMKQSGLMEFFILRRDTQDGK